MHLRATTSHHHWSGSSWLVLRGEEMHAHLVGDYRKWQEVNRHVHKGETRITILAPLIKRDPANPDERILYGFRNVFVFNVSQTNGEPLPTPETPKLLTTDNHTIHATLTALTVGGAMREAIRSRPEWEDPYYWAGFTLPGLDDSTIQVPNWGLVALVLVPALFSCSLSKQALLHESVQG